MKKRLLLLEGGAYRGIFTSGVLDAFLEANVEFDTVVGISAGALCGYNYVSKDFGRNKEIIFEYGQDKRYFGLRNLIKTGSAFGSKFVFEELPCNLKFNYEEFKKGPNFIVGATNCETGQCEYFEKSKDEFEKCIVASASMPIVSRMVNIDDKLYLDGGISEHLPLGFISDEYDEVVCVLTKPITFRKKRISKAQGRLYKVMYKKYPSLLEKLLNEDLVYNQQREKAEKLYSEGLMKIVQPDERFKVRRVERNKKYIHEGYELGFEAGMAFVDKLGE
ncbi:MAG: patatin family protein [Erysipelotrichaceae bacterium]|nr:patatin family protein [Erysipelotrichaceae bacterium]